MEKNLKKISLVIAWIVLVAGIVGGYFYPENKVLVGTVGSAVGTTFNTAKVAQINVSPTIGATSTGLLNGDGTDRYIESTFAACSGVGTSMAAYSGTGGIANWTITSATGTSQAPATITNSNAVVATIATSTPDSYVASTTMQSLWRVWATGTYYNFAFNATNTAACTVGVHYLGS